MTHTHTHCSMEKHCCHNVRCISVSFKVKKLMFHYFAYYDVLRHKSHNKLIQRSDKRKIRRVRENCVTDTCNITGHTLLVARHTPTISSAVTTGRGVLHQQA